MLDALYREVILDHYRSPRNKGTLDGDVVVVELNNPVCGDEIALYLQIEDGAVANIAFDGRGCSISQASASMMTDAVKGKEVKDALRTIARFKGMMQGEVDGSDGDLGDLAALQGVTKFPVRIKCALLAWEALYEGMTK